MRFGLQFGLLTARLVRVDPRPPGHQVAHAAAMIKFEFFTYTDEQWDQIKGPSCAMRCKLSASEV
jgi:hypothetical protein